MDQKAMTRTTRPESGRDEERPADANEVRLTGRVTSPPVSRELPSGDVVVTFRVTSQRGSTTARGGGRRSDSVPCAAWTSRLRRSIATWRPGDEVEVVGSLRCRFFRSGGVTGSRVEVEVTSARITRRAPVA